VHVLKKLISDIVLGLLYDIIFMFNILQASYK